ncbi:MAG: tRNA dihydrouridine synthase DusB [Sporichthyaceae bacterium]|nr:tRNA dihydrouridine synthase DusB [Sporichthyaceae bacterium]
MRTLKIGTIAVDPPVVLAPMAGITNSAFRLLCRRYGGGLYVSEMITSRALVERNPETLRMIRFDPEERPRSLQLYGVDPAIVGAAVGIVVDEDLADHIDLNFGCPVPKVTRKGGGAALPYKRPLLRQIIRAAVTAADGRIPITVKTRTGISDQHLTYLDAGRIAQDEGVAAVALHGRTAAQMYGGAADWTAIERLVQALDIPVLGNGDIWTATGALRMMHRTGCAGVVVGRGCLGRPWLFGELEAAFAGRPPAEPPRLGEVAKIMYEHASLLADDVGDDKAARDFRKHVAWYLKGFPVGQELRARLGMVSSLIELAGLLGELDPDQPYPADVAAAPRGRGTGARRVALPDGWLDDPNSAAVDPAAELDISGG